MRWVVVTHHGPIVSSGCHYPHMSPSLRSIAKDHADLVVARLRLTQEQRMGAGHQRFQDGYRAAMEALGRRPTTSWLPHPQTELQGIEVDERMAPLLEALWRFDFVTQFSCQGDPEHYIADEVGTHEALAYIAFAEYEQSSQFVTQTVDLLGYVPWQEGRLVCGPMVPRRDTAIRGSAQFPPTLLEDITQAWVSHASARAAEL